MRFFPAGGARSFCPTKRYLAIFRRKSNLTLLFEISYINKKNYCFPSIITFYMFFNEFKY